MIDFARRNWYVCLLLAVAAVAVYGHAVRHDFIGVDDYAYVVDNPFVKQEIGAQSLIRTFTREYDSNWIPLVWISYMIDHQTGGDAGPGKPESPVPYHRTNLILHVLNTLLLFAFLQGVTGAKWRSAFVAGLFALHPMHVESVAWIAERKDVLSTFFLLLTLIAYAWYIRKPGVGRYVVVIAAFACGLMSKSMLVTVPFLLLLVDFWPLRRWNATGEPGVKAVPLRELVIEKLPMLAMAAAVGVVTIVQQRHAGAVGTLAAFPVGVRLANAVVSYAAYVCKMVWPARLSFFYAHPGTTLPAWQVWGGLAAVTGATVAAIRLARRCPFVAAGWLWYVVSLLPVIGIVQVGDIGMADRYTYVPYIGLFVALAWAVPAPKGATGRTASALAAVAVLACLGAAAHREVGYWRNDATLFGRAAALDPKSVRAHYGLAYRLVEEGRLEEAIPHYRALLGASWKSVKLHLEFAGVLERLGRERDAAEEYRKVLRIEPENWPAANNLAATLAAPRDPSLRNPGEAVRLAELACRLTQGSRPDVLDTLATAYASAGRYEDAVSTAERALPLARASGDATLVTGIENRIRFFRSHRPHTEP